MSVLALHVLAELAAGFRAPVFCSGIVSLEAVVAEFSCSKKGIHGVDAMGMKPSKMSIFLDLVVDEDVDALVSLWAHLKKGWCCIVVKVESHSFWEALGKRW